MSDNRYYVNYGAAAPAGFLAANGTYLQSFAASIAIGWITYGTNSFATSQVLASDRSAARQRGSVPSSGLVMGSYSVTGGWTVTLTAYPAVGQGSPVSLQSETENGSYIVSSQG